MKNSIVFGLLIISLSSCFGQGYNHQWLLGYGGWANKGRIVFDTSSYTFSVEQRKMKFDGTQGNICDANGNFLMSSNGVWIANANNDTMQNGAGLNPGSHVNSYPDGLYLPNANVIIPFPGDSTKYVLLHHSAESNGIYDVVNQLFYSVIDLSQSNGFGSVILKNQLIINDTMNWGIAACKREGLVDCNAKRFNGRNFSITLYTKWCFQLWNSTP